MRIAILGGAFDPPHFGHISIAEVVLEKNLADRVWLMPASIHAYHKDMATVLDRLQMCWLACRESLPEIEPSSYEISKSELREGSTLAVMRGLFDDPYFKENKFSLIIGQDNAVTIEHWINYQTLIKTVNFIVTPRQGEPSYNAWYHQPPHIFLSDVVIPDISSTQIRSLVKKGDWYSIEGLVPQRVYHYIRMRNLYV